MTGKRAVGGPRQKFKERDAEASEARAMAHVCVRPAPAEEPVNLRRMLHGLEVEARREVHVKRFAQAKEQHSVLTPYMDPAGVLAALKASPGKEPSEREDLCWALVTEQRDRPHPLWAAMLAATYAPMLLNLRASVFAGLLPADEIEQLIVAGFLQAVASFPRTKGPGGTSRFLRQYTRRRFYRVINTLGSEDREAPCAPSGVLAAFAESTVVDFEEEAAPPDAVPPEDLETVFQRLVEAVGGALPDSHLRLIADTVVRGERLDDYVRRVHPTATGAEFARIYERLKRQRTRTVTRLRTRLARAGTGLAHKEDIDLAGIGLLATGRRNAPHPEQNRSSERTESNE